jgi:hypothetical protein
MKSVTNTGKLFKCHYLGCFKQSKEEIIINYNSGEANPAFVMTNLSTVNGIVITGVKSSKNGCGTTSDYGPVKSAEQQPRDNENDEVLAKRK